MIRRTRSSIDGSNSVDSNNNVLSSSDRAPIELSLSDGKKIAIGDNAWIRHNQCLDTPVIVQNIDGKENS